MVDMKEIAGLSVLHRCRKRSSCDETNSKTSQESSERHVEKLTDCFTDEEYKKYNKDGNLYKKLPRRIDATADRTTCFCRCHSQSQILPPRHPLSTSSRQNIRRNSPASTGTGNHPTREPRSDTEPLERLDRVTNCAPQCSESYHRDYTSSRQRLKNDSFQLDPCENTPLTSSTISTISGAESLYSSRSTKRLAKKKKMLRILCQATVVVLLSLCGGVLMYKHNHAEYKSSEVIHKLPSTGINPGDYDSSEETPNVVLDLPFKGVPIDELERRLEESSSVADMLKIFFDDSTLSQDEINSIMWMKSHQSMYGSDVSRQRRNHNLMNDAEHDDEENREKALKHAQEVARSPYGNCRDPVPELVPVEEPQRTTFKHYFPRCTILHRCRNLTGCCPKGYTCGPKKENGLRIVDRYFLVFKKSVDDTVVPHVKHLVESRVFINHTDCECHKIEIETNCHKSCPYQFVKERPGENCICRCKPHNRQCRHMYRGIIPLDEKDLECIKSGECIQPECHSGEFTVQTGMCPPFRHHRHHRNK